MSVCEDDVRKVARLARIHIEEEQVAQLTSELGQIMDWIDLLGQCDTKGVEPLAGVTSDAMPMRPDTIVKTNSRDDVLANAPESDEGYFVVPKVVE
jgi:aspartyl/glutamyl-tRNA(Asn/Gln) amidotransferase, C subunit